MPEKIHAGIIEFSVAGTTTITRLFVYGDPRDIHTIATAAVIGLIRKEGVQEKSFNEIVCHGVICELGRN
jgi:hypothetical protein